MGRTVKRIWNCLNFLLIAAVVLLMFALVGVRLVGLEPYMVLSGSMEPTYPVGSLIYVRHVQRDQLQVGDPVTYMMDANTLVTHRIVDILADADYPENVRYVTQGDANPVPDNTPVHYRQIVGKAVFAIPNLGYLSDYIQHPPGLYVTISIGAVLILSVILPDVLFPEKKGKKKEEA